MRQIKLWLLLLPGVVLLAAFTHIPIVTTIWQSFFSNAKGARPAHFLGIDNYQDLLDDPIFWQALSNNIRYAIATVPPSICLSLVMALAANAHIKGRAALRLAYFTPTVLPMIAVANIWLFFYTPGYGLLDQLLHLVGQGDHVWLGSPTIAIWCVAAVAVWKESGFFMIFYLAALQQIPPELIEAATLEGAGRLTIFRRVTLPLLMPTTLFILVNAMINAFRLIDHIFVLTHGGPNNATSILLYRIYELGFRFLDQAGAATLTVILLLVLVILALGQFVLLDRRVHYR